MANDLCWRSCRRRCCRCATRSPWQVILAVRHPDVSVPVHMDSMRKHHESCAEALHQLPGFIKLQHNIDVWGVHARVGTTALGNPNGLTVKIRIDSAG